MKGGPIGVRLLAMPMRARAASWTAPTILLPPSPFALNLATRVLRKALSESHQLDPVLDQLAGLDADGRHRPVPRRR